MNMRGQWHNQGDFSPCPLAKSLRKFNTKMVALERDLDLNCNGATEGAGQLNFPTGFQLLAVNFLLVASKTYEM